MTLILTGWDFDENEDNNGNLYSKKIEAPIYKIKDEKPLINELVDNTKTLKLIDEINQSNISDDEKIFLIQAAQRHLIFDYHKIADYYAHSNKNMQDLMEKSALVIIDFNKAIENGWIKLSEEIIKEYNKEYSEK